MSNINATPTTMLRGNETLKNRFQILPNYDSCLQPSGPSQNAPQIISKPKRPKYGGRGMAIRELAESLSADAMNKTILNFSNACIERHFKSLREENEKKLKETNEKIWGKCIHSDRSS
ncbi:uncharacterized protein LOC103311516 [Acyrthosiphon pisum]|uniref:Uncharacterized protein n=1 Tax=Acyrthosiphon pisum TaxID=7029 RepID=A0A8R2FEZ3_ACYPI|nr:uncharacterized protein LOC103311516 [Acyrthosiphon pisum]XP_016664882.1 uncharacterized protein LOC103311516 [Acyrthosiphon pisum]XP_016664890.1 uncharacterized protein LOC103311516 [Acyrthosiphon pisum]|eukprot:XP_008189374.1 PREDICTED: uncharacterized protein LOC103311516 [Acyrthosiphon pisum]